MKNIENLAGDELRKEIINQNKNFDLIGFYFGKTNDLYATGAVVLATNNNNVIKAYSKLDHGSVAKNILKNLYDDFDDFYFPDQLGKDVEWKSWQEQTVNMNIVCFQLVTDYAIIWIPNEINNYQYSIIEEFYNQISNKISVKDMLTNIKDKEGNTLNLQQAIPIIKNRIINYKPVKFNEQIKDTIKK